MTCYIVNLDVIGYFDNGSGKRLKNLKKKTFEKIIYIFLIKTHS